MKTKQQIHPFVQVIMAAYLVASQETAKELPDVKPIDRERDQKYQQAFNANFERARHFICKLIADTAADVEKNKK